MLFPKVRIYLIPLSISGTELLFVKVRKINSIFLFLSLKCISKFFSSRRELLSSRRGLSSSRRGLSSSRRGLLSSRRELKNSLFVSHKKERGFLIFRTREHLKN